MIIQALDPWMSSEDIEKGEAWFTSISESLVKSEGIGIFCLTPENLNAQWLAYEAGALAGQDRARLATFLFDVTPGHVKPLLGLFQSTVAKSKDDVLKLLQTLNNRMGKPVSEQILQKAFTTYWPELEAGLKNIGPGPGVALPKNADTNALIEEILSVVRRIERDSTPRFVFDPDVHGGGLLSRGPLTTLSAIHPFTANPISGSQVRTFSTSNPFNVGSVTGGNLGVGGEAGVFGVVAPKVTPPNKDGEKPK